MDYAAGRITKTHVTTSSAKHSRDVATEMRCRSGLPDHIAPLIPVRIVVPGERAREVNSVGFSVTRSGHAPSTADCEGLDLVAAAVAADFCTMYSVLSPASDVSTLDRWLSRGTPTTRADVQRMADFARGFAYVAVFEINELSVRSGLEIVGSVNDNSLMLTWHLSVSGKIAVAVLR